MVPLKITGRFPGPKQRQAYEKALGEFLVAFNRMENVLRELVELSLDALGRPEFWKHLKGAGLPEQARYMVLLSMANPKLPDIPFEAVLELNSNRNALAHGHYYERFDRDGYTIVGKDKERPFPIEDINKLAEHANEIAGEFERDLLRMYRMMDEDELGLST